MSRECVSGGKDEAIGMRRRRPILSASIYCLGVPCAPSGYVVFRLRRVEWCPRVAASCWLTVARPRGFEPLTFAFGEQGFISESSRPGVLPTRNKA
jgi:hypothetical protein